jgi:hypothetical protein
LSLALKRFMSASALRFQRGSGNGRSPLRPIVVQA